MFKKWFDKRNFHWTNDSYQVAPGQYKYPWFINGRAWVTLFKRIGIEWCWRKEFRLGAAFSLGGYEDARSINFHLSIFFVSFYLEIENIRSKKIDWKSENREREFGIKLFGMDKDLYFDFKWNYQDKAMHWETRKPGIHIFFGFINKIFGYHNRTEKILETKTDYILMPEGKYKAILTKKVNIWKRPRWIIPIIETCIDIEVDGGIPFPGKGENSWDCDEDGLYATGFKTKFWDDAINKFRASVNEYRTRYGGANWLPENYKYNG